MDVKKYRNVVGMIFVLVLLIVPLFTFAQNTTGPNFGNTTGPREGNTTGPATGFTFENPLNADNFCELLRTIFNVIVIFAIPIAVVFVVYAGFKFVAARGNPEGLKKARANLVATLLGIALFFGAWFLAQVIANTLVELGGSEFNTCF